MTASRSRHPHPAPTVDSVLDELRAQGHPVNAAGMARFGIRTDKALGVSVPAVRALAKHIGRHHALALELWESEVHEARLLTAFIGSAAELSEDEMERLAGQVDSWDICDQLCGELFAKHPLAYAKAAAWSKREEEFVKRAAFALMARLAVRDKKAEDAKFLAFLPLIEQEADDDRNMVKKAVSWALRQIGKRNRMLHEHAMTCGERIAAHGSRAARWIASDALRELRKPEVIARLKP
ncbi:MAG: DNA alkylation repair protein [Roseimicrobium sp.]